nr:hypothetical protein [Bacillus pumilus]
MKCPIKPNNPLEMLAIPSPTGFTDTIVRYVAERLEELGIPFEMTRRGTIRATLKGQQNSPDRAVSAHLDTIGAAVRAVKDNGRLTLAPVGCWSSRFAEGSRVSLFTDNGVIRGSVLPLMASGHAFNTAVDEMPISWDHIELRLDAYCATRADCDSLGRLAQCPPQWRHLRDHRAKRRHGPRRPASGEVPRTDAHRSTGDVHRRHAGCHPGCEEKRNHHLLARRPGAIPRRPRRSPARPGRQDYKPRSVIWERYAKDVQWGDGTAKSYILPWVPVTTANADALYQQVSGTK